MRGNITPQTRSNRSAFLFAGQGLIHADEPRQQRGYQHELRHGEQRNRPQQLDAGHPHHRSDPRGGTFDVGGWQLAP